ncbi:MAG: histidinol-phosphatase [Chloroflexota bacterium]|nr:histidinol-phosphatase [Chloroflexota bacterium]
MVLANYHTHNRWCDGQGEIEEVIEAAIAAGMGQVGISSHAPVPFPAAYALPLDDLRAYREEVLRLRAVYRGRIEVLLGLELDALPGLRDFNRQRVLAAPFDFCIGSVHFLGTDDAGAPWPLDESDERFAALLAARYGGDIRRLVEEYYGLVAGLAGYPGVAIVGHLDRGAKLWNAGGRYFSEDAPWYRAAVEGALRALAASNLIVELSTGGWRRGLDTPFPSPWIVRRCRDLGIPMTVCSDAHRPDQIAYAYDRALALLRETGHQEIAYFDRAAGGWAMGPLPMPPGDSPG